MTSTIEPMRNIRLTVALLSAVSALAAAPAGAATGYCRPKGALPAGHYRQTCACTVEHCDYLVCTCDGQYRSSFKITTCTSQSFSDRGGVLTCD